MKKKPDLSSFGAPKNPNEFLAGGAAAAAEKHEQVPQPPVAPAPSSDGTKITKTIRMARSMDLRLKEEAHRRSMASGKRVTESDLIDLALELGFRSGFK